MTPRSSPAAWSAEATTDDLVDDLVTEAEAHDEGEADPTFEVEVGERTWTGLNVSWIADGEPVYGVHLLTPVEAGEVHHVVRLTGRVAGPESEEDYEAVQGILEMLRIPYTHSGVLASALGMHKPTARRLFVEAGLPVADGMVIRREQRAAGDPMARPFVVKAINEGSSVGVSLV